MFYNLQIISSTQSNYEMEVETDSMLCAVAIGYVKLSNSGEYIDIDKSVKLNSEILSGDDHKWLKQGEPA